ncbi:Holliday junction branch migration protein RuvA [Membranihabitans maritimus]|uniref:Holliday junction branch migration protein RuvA n=1 Tax=Membranihabitans maritimus TaxID=2904244 RepID=UPI001F00CFD5|nr:Holliday junction branch migration protein RuvA [Membranihabitans maritimus]
MYEYIKGTLTEKNPTYVIIETRDIGYYINISLNTFSRIQALSEAKLYTYLYIREDIRMLFGFASKEERSIFELFLGISGIGPNTARLVISSMTPDQIIDAVTNEDDIAFKNVKGIGAKTAKRIIIDLKDKVRQIEGTEINSGPGVTIPGSSSAEDEAREALMTLGFPRNKVHQALSKVKKAQTAKTVEDYIKQALKLLS